MWKPIKYAPQDGRKLLLWTRRLGWEHLPPAIVIGRYYCNDWWVCGAIDTYNYFTGKGDMNHHDSALLPIMFQEIEYGDLWMHI
jgi:hypothetical protein